MGIKDTFTDSEWMNLLSLPYAVSTALIAAAPSFLGARSESKAMMMEPAKLAATSGSALVTTLSAEMQSRAEELVKEQQNLLKRDQTGYRTKTIEAAKAATAALTKTSPEEAMAYKKWVLAIGQKVAEATKEHGIAVCEPEIEVLIDISVAFGIGA